MGRELINKTAAVEKALDDFLEKHLSLKKDDAMLQEVDHLFDEIARLPVLDERTPDEILGYDKDGLV